jgi:hypothetical protein
MIPISLAGQQHGFRALELFRLAVEDDYISIAQHGVAGRFTAEDSQAPDAGEHHFDTAAAHVA